MVETALSPLNRHSIPTILPSQGGYSMGPEVMIKIQRAPPCGGKSGKIACQGFHGLRNILNRLVHSLAIRLAL